MPESRLSSTAVYSARPTLRVKVQEYPMASRLLQSMEMTEQEGGMSALELRFGNEAMYTTGEESPAFEDGRILELGNAIAVYGGDENAPQEIFQGKITGLEISFPQGGVRELVVLAEDTFQQARMMRRTKIHEDVSIADLATQLANQLNLTPVITGFTIPIGTQVQLNESDLAFLRRILVRYGGDLQIVGTSLHISPRSEVQRGELELHLGSQLYSARVLADLAHQVTEVTVGGWNAKDGRVVKGESRGAHLLPGSGQTGAQLLRKTLGYDRTHHISHLAVMTDAEAQAVADTAFDSRARQFVCVEGIAEGNPALRVGTHVQLFGLGDRFSNTYYVTRTCHRFGEMGYETHFEAECAFWRGN